ncbi:MAG: T9SS type A sorting domain-containing protein [Ignavibacteria bacterium]|jgi:hypothetical protein|nr:T9SS type A sorting domain-containing protein [Ignavibacteria bacterium]
MKKNMFLAVLVFLLGNFYCLSTPYTQYFSIEQNVPIEPYLYLPNEQGGITLIGDIQVDHSLGIIILDLVPSVENSDSLVVNFYNKFFVNDTSRIGVLPSYSKCYRKENGNVVVITMWFSMQTGGFAGGVFAFQVPYVIEFDGTTGDIVYSYNDLKDGGFVTNYFGMQGQMNPVSMYPDGGFVAFNEILQNKNDSVSAEVDSLRKYQLLARIYDSLGYLINVESIKGINVTPPDSAFSRSLTAYQVITDNNGNFYLVILVQDAYYTSQQYVYKYNKRERLIKINPSFEVISEYDLPVMEKSNYGIYNQVRQLYINKNGELVVLHTRVLSDKEFDNGLRNVFITLFDTSDLSVVRNFEYADRYYAHSNYGYVETSKGDLLNASRYNNAEYIGTNQFNYAAYIISNDFHTSLRTYENPDTTQFEDELTITFERPDGKYEFWGRYYDYAQGQIIRLILDDEDLTPKEFNVGIEEIFLKTDFNSKLYPNPATDNTTLTLELQQASQVRISLNDMLGREIKQIYNAFTDAGTFTHSFATTDLPKGIYYLKIFIGGEVMVEKVVVNLIIRKPAMK